MQNKGAIQIFAILLAIACLYHLSFTYITNRIERKAVEFSEGDPTIEKDYLDSITGVKLPAPWGWLGYNYNDAKQRELNLGLDLKGGMNVTLEVSIPDLLIAMTKNSLDSGFVQALRSAREIHKDNPANFVDIFVAEYEKLMPNGSLSNPLIFGHGDQSQIKPGMSNNEVKAILKKESVLAVDRTYEVLMARIDNFGVTQPNIQKLDVSGRILVELPGVNDPQRVQSLLEASAKLEFWLTYHAKDALPILGNVNQYLGSLNLNQPEKKDSTTITDTTQTDGDTSQTATIDDTANTGTETDIAASDSNTNKEALSAEEYKKENPLFGILQPFFNQQDGTFLPGPRVGYASTFDTAKVMSYLRMPKVIDMLPKDLVFAWSQKPIDGTTNVYELIALRKNPNSRDRSSILEGDVIYDASFAADDRGGGFRVEMKMNKEGAAEWSKITKEAAAKEPKESIAIVLDGKVCSYPTVQDQIANGISSITGSFGFEDAKTLASVLKAGKLPVKANIVEQAVVGPSLGQKAINSGLLSLAVAFLIVMAYMAFYYGRAGITADLALMANLFFLVGSLAALNTTLTLPGITGILLTIGMSVDANVLIFERVREELRHGKGLKLAIADGYKQAYRAIIDSNVTTLLIALILILFGAGPVKSFAVTLFVGILTSMFSAIFITRLIFEAQLAKKKKITFSNKFTENIMAHTKINFVGKRKIYYIISSIVIIISIASFAIRGFNLGVDLQGGRSYTIVFDNSNFSTPEIAEALETKFGSIPTVKYYGSMDQIKVMTKYKYTATGNTVDQDIEEEMYEVLKPFYKTDISLEEFISKSGLGVAESYKVGPAVAEDVTLKSFYAIVISIIMMFIYILIRFKGWHYGLGALVSTVHDVVIVLGVFSLLDGFLPFSLEVDQGIIAAVLTVIGLSLNDTVVIFDRIREYLGEGRKDSMHSIINAALNSTLGRTINTSLTVFFVLIVAFLFGGESIKGLTFAMLIGIVVATYSSIFIATPIVVDLKGRKKSSANADDNKKLAKA